MRRILAHPIVALPAWLDIVALIAVLPLASACGEDSGAGATTSATGGQGAGGSGLSGGSGAAGGAGGAGGWGAAGGAGAAGAAGGAGAATGCSGGAEPIDPAAYYVATTGDDSNPGTEALPWRTIQKAADTLNAGETVYIRAGTYQEQVIAASSGTSGAYITFAGYPGEEVFIDGTDVAMGDYEPLFSVGEQSYVRIQGLAVENSTGQGIGDVDGNVDNGNIVVRNCSTFRTQISGVHFSNAHDVTVDCVHVDTPNLTEDQEGISFVGVDQFEISNCTLIRQQKEGIDAKVGCSNGKIRNNTILEPNLSYPYSVAIYVDAAESFCSNIEIYENTIIGCAEGFDIGGEGGGTDTNINMHHNTIDGCGIGFAVDDYGSPVQDGTIIDHNTLTGITGCGVFLLNPDAVGTRVTHNTVSGSGEPLCGDPEAIANTYFEGNSF